MYSFFKKVTSSAREKSSRSAADILEEAKRNVSLDSLVNPLLEDFPSALRSKMIDKNKRYFSHPEKLLLHQEEYEQIKSAFKTNPTLSIKKNDSQTICASDC